MNNQPDLAPETRAALLLRKYRAAFDVFCPYHEARLYALLPDNITLASMTVLRNGTAEPERWALLMGQGISGMAAITGVPNLYHDAHRHPHSTYRDPSAYQEQGDQAMVAPIKAPNADTTAVLFLNRLGHTWWLARDYASFLSIAEQIRQDWFAK